MSASFRREEEVMTTTVEAGTRGETLAAQALERRGYEIVERNWRCQGGEIDLVARDGDVWVFVEVKLRGAGAFGTPEEAIDARKQARLLHAVQMYLAEHELDDAAVRIDVVAIELAPSGKVRRMALYQDAVWADG